MAILSCFAFSTIAYSAINLTMNISGSAFARVEADIRITNFKLSANNNAISLYEEYSKNIVASTARISAGVDSIIYDVELTNYGYVDMGIFNITGLPSGLTPEIINYNLKDKICDDTGKCNGMAKKAFQIKLSGAPGDYEFVLHFDFREYHSVKYTNIENNNYPTEVIDGGDLNITFTENLNRISVLSNGTQINYYESITSGQTITIPGVTTDIEIKQIPPVATLMSGSLTEPGSLVCIEDECFYIISNDGTTVTMLARYNLLVGNYAANSQIAGLTLYNHSISPTPLNYLFNDDYKVIQLAREPEPYNYYALTNPTGIQDSTAKAYDPFAGFPYIGTLSYSSTTEHLTSYKTYLETKAVNISTIRNITLEELQNLGCEIGEGSCPTNKKWIYSSSYWTSTPNYHMNYSMEIENYLGSQSSDFESLNGVRPVIEMSVTDIYSPDAKHISGNIDTPGAEVCIGDECFYTISSTENTVTMISKYNLYTGGSYNGSTYTVYGSEATGKQDESMIGYDPITTSGTGVLAYSSKAYWNNTVSYPANIFNSNSNLYTPVMNYKNYIKTLGVIPTEARLITFEELKKLGCNIDSKTCTSSSYPFVYSTSYWTGSAYSSTYIYRIRLDGVYSNSGFSYTDNWGYGVRPVITIPKQEIMKTVEFTIAGLTYKTEIGMTWLEWVNSKYNVAGFTTAPGDYIYLDGEHIGADDCTPSDEIIDPSKTYVFLSYQC